MRNDLEQKVRRYIKMKKFFMFSDALLITGLSKDKLEKVLIKLEKEGLIVQDKDNKSIMNSSYIVISKEKKSTLIKANSCVDFYFLKSIKKITTVLNESDETNFIYLKLMREAKLSRGTFARAIKVLVNLEVLREFESKTYSLDKSALDELHTFLKQKDYKKLQEVLEGKKPLRYVAVPKELNLVLGVIISNEVLKRDELAILSKITRKQLTNQWQLLKKLGLIIDSFKEDAKDRVTYIFSSKRAKSVLKHIEEGAWEKDKELKSLWIL